MPGFAAPCATKRSGASRTRPGCAFVDYAAMGRSATQERAEGGLEAFLSLWLPRPAFTGTPCQPSVSRSGCTRRQDNKHTRLHACFYLIGRGGPSVRSRTARLPPFFGSPTQSRLRAWPGGQCRCAAGATGMHSPAQDSLPAQCISLKAPPFSRNSIPVEQSSSQATMADACERTPESRKFVNVCLQIAVTWT